VVGYQSFGGQCCLHLQDEDADCDVNKEGSCWPPSCTCFCAYWLHEMWLYNSVKKLLWRNTSRSVLKYLSTNISVSIFFYKTSHWI